MIGAILPWLSTGIDVSGVGTQASAYALNVDIAKRYAERLQYSRQHGWTDALGNRTFIDGAREEPGIHWRRTGGKTWTVRIVR